MMVAVVFFVFLAGVCSANDLETDLGIATFNIPDGADIAGMGNADASAWGWSSNNPALSAFDFSEGGKFKNSGSLNWGNLNFKKGPTINFYALSQTRKIGENFFTVVGTYFSSDREDTKIGLETRFRPCRSVDVTWARKVGKSLFSSVDELYFGTNLEIGRTKANFYLREEGRRQTFIQSDSRSVGGSVGLLYRTGKLNVGTYWNRIWEKAEESYPLDGEKSHSRSHSDKFRIGASYQILEGTFIAGDYQFLDIDGESFNQFFGGVEQRLTDWLYLYGGIANHNPTAGLGIYFDRGGFNLAYAEMDELKSHFGKGRLITAIIFFSF